MNNIKRMGFTLIEMMAIIILLTVIMIVVAPSMIGTLKSSNAKRFSSFKENLKIVTENYAVNNKLISGSRVSISTLLEEDYIDSIPEVPADDPLASSDTDLTSYYVEVTKGLNGYSYKLCESESKCEDL